MKRTIQINLAGSIFAIDDNAYEMLRDYLLNVERQFSGRTDGREVINDLEMRMAELFTEKLKPHREVISLEDVREVLQTIGYPEDISGKQSGGAQYGPRFTRGRGSKRLYRDPDDKPIGGVCSGLAYYFNTDPLLIRILFIIALFMGFGFLLYIVLWIALPLAQTPEQITEMKTGSQYF
ncbi:MAG: PspC domain-containing protein [Bacteroidales bacterium]|jgi:phage shock protein PspC (stress-responsive transcriptional regulator)|nr:PspC domain-containing protein [Bacteroidales bacterium]MDD2571122.1 PspC domain-containing protein [Bacteroidales bacterium]MDD3871976.1 PspC domain-containing protein [Bacteroidales bacterium]MDD4813308.1 PspC domain-containing protein [Bacteroidales bacterium]NLO68615.1 PspC domain-containing protein [Bacteroidales bacterium]